MDYLRTPVLDNHRGDEFTPLKTIYLVCFSIVLMLLVEFVTLVYVFGGNDTQIRCDLFYLLVYALVSLWFINFIIRCYIKWRHKHCLIAKNLFDLDQDCIRFIEIPFYISCIWLGVLVVILCLFAEYDVPHSAYCDVSYFSSPVVTVIIAITIQNVLIIPQFVIYIIKINRFNKSHRTIEEENDTLYMPNPLQHTLASADVGFRERCEVIDNMLERQAELIRYYKEANEVLNKKIFQLTAQGHTATET